MGGLPGREPGTPGRPPSAGLARLVERLAGSRGRRARDGALRLLAPRAAAARRRRHPRLRPAELRRGPRRGRPAAAPAPTVAEVPVRLQQDPARHRRDPPPGRLAVGAAGLARPAREGHVHGHPHHRRHRLRQDLGGAVPVHGPAHPPARRRPGPEDGRAHHRRQGQLRRLRARAVRPGRPPGRLLRGQPHERRPLEHHRPPGPQRGRPRRPHRRHDRERPGDLPGRPLLAPGGEGPGLSGDPRSPARRGPRADDGLALPGRHVLRGLRGVRQAGREAHQHRRAAGRARLDQVLARGQGREAGRQAPGLDRRRPERRVLPLRRSRRSARSSPRTRSGRTSRASTASSRKARSLPSACRSPSSRPSRRSSGR